MSKRIEVYGEPGRHLFHYTSAEVAVLHILPQRRLRLSPYTRMRDPQEAKTWPLELAPGESLATTELLPGGIELLHRTSFLLSLSRDEGARPRDRGYGLERTWEEYAQDHRGVCLVFDGKRLLDAARTHLPDTTEAGPVDYLDGGIAASPVRHVPDLKVGEWFRRIDLAASGAELAVIADRIREEFVWLFEEERSREHDPERLACMLLAERFQLYLRDSWEALYRTKDSVFSHEQEYRVAHVAVDRDVPDWVFLPYGDALTAVILGRDFPAELLRATVTACAFQRVPVGRLDWSAGYPRPESLSPLCPSYGGEPRPRVRCPGSAKPVDAA